MFRENPVEMVSNGLIGRRLLNVREAAQYLGLEVDTVYKKVQVAGGSLRQGRSCVAVRCEGA